MLLAGRLVFESCNQICAANILQEGYAILEIQPLAQGPPRATCAEATALPLSSALFAIFPCK